MERENAFLKALNEEKKSYNSSFPHFLSIIKSFEQIKNITSVSTIRKHYYDCPRRDIHRLLLIASVKEVYDVWNQELYESFLKDGKGNVQVITQMVWGKFRDGWNKLMKERHNQNVMLKRNSETVNGGHFSHSH